MKATARLTLTLVVVLAVGSIPAMAQRLDMNTFSNPDRGPRQRMDRRPDDG